MMKNRAWPAGALIAGIHGAVFAQCDHSRELSLDLEAADARVLSLVTGAGQLEVRGVEGKDQVSVTGRACASSERLVEEIAFEDESRGDRLLLRTRLPDSSGGWWGGSYARLDVRVEMPRHLMLEIDDGSGSIELEDIGPAVISDSSGEIEILRAGGDLDIDDGSGEVRIRDLAGDLVIEDGSGEIDIQGVTGSVIVEEDGSGEIDIRGVTQDIVIVEDGSGSIDIADVGGSVTIEDDGSGSINVRDVGGSLEVRADGSGDLRYSRIEGSVRVPGERLE